MLCERRRCQHAAVGSIRREPYIRAGSVGKVENYYKGSELGGEKIDIIPWSSDPLEFIAKALSPAKVIKVTELDGENSARVIVPDDKLSLAIGRDGQNARLAVRLTGWKIDVKSESVALGEFGDDKEEISE